LAVLGTQHASDNAIAINEPVFQRRAYMACHENAQGPDKAHMQGIGEQAQRFVLAQKDG
jgi:hypothetical protein